MHPFVSRAFVVVVVVRDTQSPTRVTPRAHPRRSARASSSTIYWRSRKGYTEYQRTVCTTCGICCGANRTNQYPFLSYPWCVVQRDRADGRARVSWTVRSVGRSGVSHLYAHTSTPSAVKYESHVWVIASSRERWKDLGKSQMGATCPTRDASRLLWWLDGVGCAAALSLGAREIGP